MVVVLLVFGKSPVMLVCQRSKITTKDPRHRLLDKSGGISVGERWIVSRCASLGVMVVALLVLVSHRLRWFASKARSPRMIHIGCLIKSVASPLVRGELFLVGLIWESWLCSLRTAAVH
jgi:hypothetical protein